MPAPLSVDSLLAKIKDLNHSAWCNQVDAITVSEWCSQFEVGSGDPERAKTEMLYLLSNLLYFGFPEVRELMYSMYRDLYEEREIQSIRSENSGTRDLGLVERKLEDRQIRTRFLPMGNPSESGSHLLYLYRQTSGLPKTQFINSYEIFHHTANGIEVRDDSIDTYIFVDDFCGSGTQACEYSKELVDPLKQLRPNVRVHYHVMFATSAGIEAVRTTTTFDEVDAVYILDKTFRTFDPDSRIYAAAPAGVDREVARSIAYSHGRSLCGPRDALGYKGGQQMLAFYHNTPDNTLPIIWSNGHAGYRWKPVFRRFSKV